MILTTLSMTLPLAPLAAAAEGDKLPPPTRAAVQMALLGIALVGMLLVVMILLGGHWVRRQGSPRRGPVVPPDRAPLPSGKVVGPPADGAPAPEPPNGNAPSRGDRP